MKHVIISLIIGLIAGFFGGYSYGNLNASAPVSPTTTISKNGVNSETVAKQLALELAPKIAESNGAKSVSILPGAAGATNLASFLLPKARAQSSCLAPTGGAIDQALRAGLENLFGSFDDNCQEARITGNLTFSVYGDVKKQEFAVNLVLNLHVVVTALKPDCRGTEIVFEGDINSEINVLIKNGEATIVDEIPAGLPLLCRGSMAINKTIGTIDPTKCPRCIKRQQAL